MSASDMISPKEYIVSEVCSPVTDVPRDEHAQEKEYIGASVDIYELNAKTPDPLLLSPTIPSQEI